MKAARVMRPKDPDVNGLSQRDRRNHQPERVTLTKAGNDKAIISMTGARGAGDLLQRRQEVIRLHLSGVPVMQVVVQTGMSWSAVNSALQLYATGGLEALTPRPRGRKPGSDRKLDAEQQQVIRDLIRWRRPRYYRLESSLWTRDLTLQLIEKRLGVTMTERALGNYLVEWGIEVGSRHEQPADRCTPSVRRWLDVNYSKILEHSRKVTAPIYWMNKARKLDGALWAPKRESQGVGVGGAAEFEEFDDDGDVYPAAQAKPRAVATYRLASAINNQGKLHWAVINSVFNAEQHARFHRNLAKDTRSGRLIIIKQDGGPPVGVPVEDWRPDADQAVWIVP